MWGFPLWAGMRAELQLILYDFVRWPVQEPGAAYGECDFLVGPCSSKPRDRAGRCLDLGLSALWPLLRSLGLGVPLKEKQEPSSRGGTIRGGAQTVGDTHSCLAHCPWSCPQSPAFRKTLQRGGLRTGRGVDPVLSVKSQHREQQWGL